MVLGSKTVSATKDLHTPKVIPQERPPRDESPVCGETRQFANTESFRVAAVPHHPSYIAQSVS